MKLSKVTLPTADTALSGREDPLPVSDSHAVSGNPLHGPVDLLFRRAGIRVAALP